MTRGRASLLCAALAVVPASCGGETPSATEQAEAHAAMLEADQRVRAERLALLEVDRLAALWTYHDIAVEGGRQRSAAIRSVIDVDTGGGPRSVQLVFRDHPAWGRSSYLVLQVGDFDCAPRCTVTVTADDGTYRMAAHRPDTDEAIAMFIDDAARLWRATGDATRIGIEFAVRVGGNRVAAFDVAGLDESRLPDWTDPN